jgi:hypothetical protein
MKFAPLMEVEGIEGMKQAIDLRLIRGTTETENLSESRLVIA